MNKIGKGLKAMIISEGYTVSSYARKCGLTKSVLNDFINNQDLLSEEEITYITEVAIIAQGLDETDLQKYLEQEANLTKKQEQIELNYKAIQNAIHFLLETNVCLKNAEFYLYGNRIQAVEGNSQLEISSHTIEVDPDIILDIALKMGIIIY